MEVERRKNKRQEQESERVKKRIKGEEEDNGSDGVPTEEEVDEFFAILRRMKVAVKYFHDKGSGRREWRQKLESPELAVVHAAAEENHIPDKQGGREVIISEGFDLNALAPEAAEGGGA